MADDTRQDEAPASGPEYSPASNGQDTPFQRFEEFVKKIAAVPKEELDEQRTEYKRKSKEKRAK